MKTKDPKNNNCPGTGEDFFSPFRDIIVQPRHPKITYNALNVYVSRNCGSWHISNCSGMHI